MPSRVPAKPGPKDDLGQEGASSPFVIKVAAVDYGALGFPPDFGPDALAGCRTQPGFTILFDGNYDPLEAANAYLHAKVRTSRGRNSQRAYADDLAQWWIYLGVHKMRWDNVLAPDIVDFRNALIETRSSTTGLFNAKATVARRVGTVEAFYRWAFAERLIEEEVVPSVTEDGPSIPRSRAMLAHLGRKRRRRSLASGSNVNGPAKDEAIRPFNVPDVRRVLAKLGPDPREVRFDAKEKISIRDRVVAETALFTGMRVMEVCGLTVNQIRDLEGGYDPADDLKLLPLQLTVTKKHINRVVLVPSKLLVALINYADVERADVLKKTKEVRKGRNEPTRLFLNHSWGNARDAGRPLKPEAASRIFSAAVKACNLLRHENVAELDSATGLPLIDPVTGEARTKPKAFAKHRFHDLRHTFATQFYMSEVAQGRTAPWKRLQALLGHTLMSTTMDVYVRHCNVAEAMYTDAFVKRMSEAVDEHVVWNRDYDDLGGEYDDADA